MKFYQELTILASLEEQFYSLWTQLYTQVHLALVEVKNPDETVSIGVSFPEYNCFEKNGEAIPTLGSKLRVFAKTEAELEQLNLNKWLERLLDYVHITSVKKVGNPVGYLLVKRYRQELNRDRKLRGLAKKNGVSLEQERLNRIAYYKNQFNLEDQEAIDYYDFPNVEYKPYIKIKSLKSKMLYSLVIDQQKVASPVDGSFNSYGFSSVATVPDF